jgi:tRNA nucleotidyltransferase/poly(A) polymerase
MRAVRFSAELDFEIEMNTRRAIVKLAGGLEAIAKERVRDELVKILMTPEAAKGIILLEELDLLRYVLPELSRGDRRRAEQASYLYRFRAQRPRARLHRARELFARPCAWHRFCTMSASRR